MTQTILLVEDDENDIILIKRAFKRHRIANSVEVAKDGDAAVAWLTRAEEAGTPPCLVLLDLKLPRRSGLEVLEWMRSRDALRRVPAVMLTSLAEERDIDRAYDLHANSYLVKPVDFDGLVEVAKALEMYWLILNTPPGGKRPGEA